MNKTVIDPEFQGGWMTGVLSIVLQTRSYLDSPSEKLPPDPEMIDLVYNQASEYTRLKYVTTDNYKQILHELKTLKDLIKAEQPDLEMMSDTAAKLMQATWNLSVQALNDFKDRILKEAKSESTSNE